jgi:DNA polymerase (family 10)
MAGPQSNAEVAATFRLLADLLSLRGESIYKVNAYRRAAESIAALPEPITAVRARGALDDIPGVGKEIALKIEQLLDTGSFPLLDEVQTEYPRSVAELLAVPGIGPKRAAALYKALGIDSKAALQRALEEGRIAAAPGFGPTFAERIAAALKTLDAADTRVPLGVARPLALQLIAALRERVPAITHIETAGSIRRFRETVGDIDLVAAAPDPRAAVEAFITLPQVAHVEMHGANRCRVILEGGLGADLWVLPEQHWGSLLVHGTGSKYHAIRLRDLALERGASLSEYGFERNGTLHPCATEEEVYTFLDLQMPPPPMRENTGEIELAQHHRLPRVVTLADIHGDMHTHSLWSDGKASIREMALAARARGYAWLCLTDHSRGLGVANGLDARRLREQRREIDALNAELAPFRVLQGVELEVRSSGALDLDDETLAALDIVIASVHSGLDQPRAKVTARALAAIRHPLVDVLAHPTGRKVGGRPGGDFDMEAIYAEAARTGTALEIDGSPDRLDLRDVHARAALAAGCLLTIDSDAHAVDALANIEYGVGTAQRAWIPTDRVLNTLPLDALLARLKRNRARRSA